MFEERDSAEETPRNRQTKPSRVSTPRSSRSIRATKKAAIGGKHQRRNKHWSW